MDLQAIWAALRRQPCQGGFRRGRVNDLDKANAEGLIRAGAEWADDPQAVAEQVDCVITCLPSPKISEAVLTGSRGIYRASSTSGGTSIEMTALGPQRRDRLAAVCPRKGVRMIEIPRHRRCS